MPQELGRFKANDVTVLGRPSGQAGPNDRFLFPGLLSLRPSTGSLVVLQLH
jgi:hypothetical protein